MSDRHQDTQNRIRLLRQDAMSILAFLNNGTHHDIRRRIGEMERITTELETMYRNATISSLSGGVAGAAGGVTSLVGLILAPFTLGTSLIVTGVGIGVAAAGGITSAASNITKMVQSKSFQEQLTANLQYCERQLRPVMDSLNRFQTNVDRLQAGLGAGRAVAGFTSILRFGFIANLSAQAARTALVVGRTIPIISSLTVILDVFAIATDARELMQMDRRSADGTPQSEMLKFIDEMRKAAATLKEALDELERMKNVIEQGMNI